MVRIDGQRRRSRDFTDDGGGIVREDSAGSVLYNLDVGVSAICRVAKFWA